MRKYFVGALLVAFAGNVFAAGWQIDLTFTKKVTKLNYTRLEMDVTPTGRFYSVNGVIYDDKQVMTPITGTCALDKSGNANCLLSVQIYSIDIYIETKSMWALVNATHWDLDYFEIGGDVLTSKNISIKPK